jgi:putative transposon-encoded protein
MSSLIHFEMDGLDMKKKDVTVHSDSACHVFVPKDWEGHEVAVILLPEDEE